MCCSSSSSSSSSSRDVRFDRVPDSIYTSPVHMLARNISPMRRGVSYLVLRSARVQVHYGGTGGAVVEGRGREFRVEESHLLIDLLDCSVESSESPSQHHSFRTIQDCDGKVGHTTTLQARHIARERKSSLDRIATDGACILQNRNGVRKT
jgi:hypothetical protein